MVRRLFPFVSMLLLVCAPVLARDAAVPPMRGQPPAAKPTVVRPTPRAESMRPRFPVTPMEAFAADPSLETASEKVETQTEEPSACRARIADRIAVIEPLPSLGGPGDCGATDVVRLEAVIQPDKTRVALKPPAVVRCTMAEAIATWMREDVTDAVATLGTAPRVLDNYASYDCRGRNRVAGAKISEHGLANAIDIRGVGLADGKFAGLTDRNLGREFRETMRKTACERFTTVLGPGADGYHESHVHLDLAERRGGYRLCQWNVLDPPEQVPLPRARPAEAR